MPAAFIRPGRRRRTPIMKTTLLFAKPGPATQPKGATATAAFVAGGILIIWLSYIHFHLWDIGYRHIATIGPLFLLQSIAGLLVGLLVIAVRRLWTAVVGIGFVLATMVGFLISVEHGLFGFKDSWAAPFAGLAFTVEIVTAVILAVAALACVMSSGRSQVRSAS
jgi:hypothetical protein